jgi:MHS family proline/betaine transporter-like MFS transporter
MPPAADVSQLRISQRSFVLAAFSTIVEWYDFTLYLYFATVLSRVFFGGGTMGLVATLGGFAVTFLFQPLGAMVFGQFGDRFGRRPMMLRTMLMTSTAMLLTALLPTYAQVGPFAGGALIALRCMMGFSVGAEYSGALAYLLEGAALARRGFITSCASAASEIGSLLAVAVSALTVYGLSADALDTWGWRIPFFVGATLAFVVWILRTVMEESPEFQARAIVGMLSTAPLRTTLAYHRAGIARSFAISALGSITYYVGITYVPVFLSTTGSLNEGTSLVFSTVAAVVVILVTPVIGALSDRFGRRPVLIGLCLLSAVLPGTMFALMAKGSVAEALAATVILAAVAGGVSAVGAVANAEQFPVEARLTGLALGATAATAIFGGLTPFLAQVSIESTGWAMMPGVMIAGVAVAVLPVFLRLPETAPCVKAAKAPA